MRCFIFLALAVTLVCSSSAVARTIFFDDFEDGVISGKWTFTGEWEEKEGHIANVESGVKFNYALPSIDSKYYTEPITIQAKGMIADLPWSRMGVAARLTESNALEAQDGRPTGHVGYALSTTENGPSDVKLLNEGVAWVTLDVVVRPQLEELVWIQLTVTEKEELVAKVWLDGEDEPENPNGTVEEWVKAGAVVKPNRPSGPVALVGKAIEAWGRGGAIPMYDEVEVWDKDGPSDDRFAVSPGSKLATTWGRVRS